ncbi:unnamed protein product [Agarophyton chilense]
MSPAQRRAIRKLPLSPQQLSSFDRARIAKTVPDKRKAVNAIVSASFSEGVSFKTDAAKYVLNRLLNGVSVSGNQTRLNFSIALVAMIRALQKTVSNSEHQIMSSILHIYGSDGSFKVDYASGERERAIGTIASCAALVRAYNGKLHPATCKEIVSLLRPCVDGNRGKWCLANSCVQIMVQFLQSSGSDVQDACAKSIWQWCEERKHFDDGLSLVLSLLQLKIASQKAVQQIYPDLASVAKPLASTFETGFSIFPGDLEVAGFVPLSWKLATNYAFSSDGRRHLGSPDKFWKLVVVEGLIPSGGSAQKKLLALNLLRVVIPLIRDEGSFETVFNSSLSSLINIIHTQGKIRHNDLPVKGTRFTAQIRKFMNRSLSAAGEAIMGRMLQSSPQSPNFFLQLFLLWAVRNGALLQILTPEQLVNMLRNIGDEDSRELLRAVVNEFASPESQNSRLSVQAIRIQALGFAFKLANIIPDLAHDVVRIFLLYSVCDDSCYQLSELSEDEQFKFDAYKPPPNVSLLGDMLPIPSPPISVNVASAAFAKLIVFITDSHKRDSQSTWISFCYNHLKLILSWNWAKPRTRHNVQNEEDDEMDDGRSVLVTLMQPIFMRLSKACGNGQNGIINALTLLSQFTGLLLLKPSVESKNQEAGDMRSLDLASSLAQELSEIASLLQDTDRVNENGTEVEGSNANEGSPDVLERTAKLICDLCTRSEKISHQISLRVIDEMSSSVDDRVIAVLFDTIEEIMQSNGNLPESTMHEESEDSNEDEDISMNSDENDSDSLMSSIQVANMEQGEQPTEIVSSDQGEDIDGKPTELSTGENGSSDSIIDMDIDDEDPAVLEALDKRLITHMKLLAEEKKTTTRRKRGVDSKFVVVRRILSVIEEVAKSLRLRLSSNKDDGRTGIVFLDLQCRLYEFVLNDVGSAGQFLTNICDIVSKQMLLPLSLIQDKVADTDTAKQIADRFLNSLCACKIEKSLSASEEQTISKSATSFIGIAAVLSNNDYGQFFPHYQNLVKLMLNTPSLALRPRMLFSFFKKSPTLSLSLLSTITDELGNTETTKNQRTRASEVVLYLATLTKENNSIPMKKIEEFWDSFYKFFQKQCEAGFKGWKGNGMQNITEIVLMGYTGKLVVVSDSDMETLQAAVKTKIQGKSGQRLLKFLRSAAIEDNQGELLRKSDASVHNDDADQAKKVNRNEN